jgi:hypothetical protein
MATTLRSTTPPLAPKRSYEDIRSPGAPPTPARAAPTAGPTASPMAPTIQETLDAFEPPLSTAPAAIGRRTTGRSNVANVGGKQDWRATLVPKKREGKGKGRE